MTAKEIKADRAGGWLIWNRGFDGDQRRPGHHDRLETRERRDRWKGHQKGEGWRCQEGQAKGEGLAWRCTFFGSSVIVGRVWNSWMIFNVHIMDILYLSGMVASVIFRIVGMIELWHDQRMSSPMASGEGRTKGLLLPRLFPFSPQSSRVCLMAWRKNAWGNLKEGGTIPEAVGSSPWGNRLGKPH